MRIAFLTNKTAITNLPVYEQLASGNRVELVHTFFYDTISEACTSPRAIIAQFGVRGIAVKTFQAILSSFRRLVGKHLGPKFVRARSPYELAVIHDLPHTTISDLNQPETIAVLQELSIDACLVCVCKNILRHQVLSLPHIEFVNVHPSLLPQYRGPEPTFWMLYHGESETGVTFHLMTAKIDDGEILTQLSMPLDPRKSETQIDKDVFKLAATVVEDVLLDLSRGRTPDAPKHDTLQSSYYTFPTPAQRRELKQALATRK